MFFQTVLFLAFWNTEKLQKMMGVMSYVWLPQILGLIAIIVTILTSNFMILFISAGVLLTVGTIRDPFFLAQVQTRIKSFNRATATSTLNAIKNISDIPLLLLVGYFANTGVIYVLIISAFLFAASIAFTPIVRKDLILNKGEW